MSQERLTDLQDDRAALEVESEETPQVEADQGPVVSPAAATSMLSGPMNAVQRRMLVQNVGQHFGNKQVQRMLGTVQRARSASAGPEGGALESDLIARIQSERSSGQPMDDGVRSQVERSVGADLSAVRVHTGPAAEELNFQMGAKAFTTGRDIFYGAGASPSDIALTTHEATHTVQQGFSEEAPSSIGAADTAHEHAAEHAASNSSSAGAGVQRESVDEEEPLQRMMVQREGTEEEEPLQRQMIQRESEGTEDEDEGVQRVIQREGADEDEMQRSMVERESVDEEEPLQRMMVQRESVDEEEPMQG